jgi:hypothetical protein
MLERFPPANSFAIRINQEPLDPRRIAILATAAAFWRVSKPAGALMVPYLIWVGFAAVLNVMIWRLN